MPTIGGRSEASLMRVPLNERITSIRRSPASAAALPGSTWVTSAPRVSGRSIASACSAETGWITTPMRPRLTCPVCLICSAAFIARSIGIAKLTPMYPPELEKICELIPTTSPEVLSSGPPELPRLIATSVWMKGTYCWPE